MVYITINVVPSQVDVPRSAGLMGEYPSGNAGA